MRVFQVKFEVQPLQQLLPVEKREAFKQAVAYYTKAVGMSLQDVNALTGVTKTLPSIVRHFWGMGNHDAFRFRQREVGLLRLSQTVTSFWSSSKYSFRFLQPSCGTVYFCLSPKRRCVLVPSRYPTVEPAAIPSAGLRAPSVSGNGASRRSSLLQPGAVGTRCETRHSLTSSVRLSTEPGNGRQ